MSNFIDMLKNFKLYSPQLCLHVYAHLFLHLSLHHQQLQDILHCIRFFVVFFSIITLLISFTILSSFTLKFYKALCYLINFTHSMQSHKPASRLVIIMHAKNEIYVCRKGHPFRDLLPL